jgi:hypothetical protein
VTEQNLGLLVGQLVATGSSAAGPSSRRTWKERRASLRAIVNDARELRRTSDGGVSWEAQRLTRDSAGFNMRAVIPRGLDASQPLIVFSVAGTNVALP